uniref:TLC domain containing 3B n=1 Tax=Neogobius melanostomus TaxID=47308 RepID=A0A8C6T060_9GOBI
MPYFVYDVAAMFLCHRHKSIRSDVIGFLRKEALLVLHHVFMVVFCFPASVFWRGGKGDFFQGVLLLPELSTPFLCLGKVLIQFERQDSLLHKVNGVVMILTFSPVLQILLFSAAPLLSVLRSAPWQCNVGAALLWPLQLYWFFLLCRAALRSVSSEGLYNCCFNGFCPEINDEFYTLPELWTSMMNTKPRHTEATSH